MAEFSSKKLHQALPVTESPSPTSISNGGGGGGGVGYWLSELASGSTQCLIRTQEVSQDFVTYGRSSRTKTLWIGVALILIALFWLWLWLRRIRL